MNDTTNAVTHTTRIEHPRGGMWRSVCTCGEVSRWCMTLKVARSLATLHVRVVTPIMAKGDN